jgi:chaperonin GroEL (HSP60 family)
MEGLKNVTAGMSPNELRKGTQQAVDFVVRFLKENSRVITTSAEIAQVATISANGDRHVGQLIAQAMEKVGKEGVITVQEGKTLEDELDITEGGLLFIIFSFLKVSLRHLLTHLNYFLFIFRHAIRPRFHLALLHHRHPRTKSRI